MILILTLIRQYNLTRRLLDKINNNLKMCIIQTNAFTFFSATGMYLATLMTRYNGLDLTIVVVFSLYLLVTCLSAYRNGVKSDYKACLLIFFTLSFYTMFIGYKLELVEKENFIGTWLTILVVSAALCGLLFNRKNGGVSNEEESRQA